jgi:hypothetical protein
VRNEQTGEELSDRYVVKDEASVNHGALSRNLPGCGPETFYITTAINYTNGYPHIGHAYEVSACERREGTLRGWYVR